MWEECDKACKLILDQSPKWKYECKPNYQRVHNEKHIPDLLPTIHNAQLLKGNCGF